MTDEWVSLRKQQTIETFKTSKTYCLVIRLSFHSKPVQTLAFRIFTDNGVRAKYAKAFCE